MASLAPAVNSLGEHKVGPLFQRGVSTSIVLRSCRNVVKGSCAAEVASVGSCEPASVVEMTFGKFSRILMKAGSTDQANKRGRSCARAAVQYMTPVRMSVVFNPQTRVGSGVPFFDEWCYAVIAGPWLISIATSFLPCPLTLSSSTTDGL